jgi:predicted nuclease of predicted toxin-antitoxin system
MTLELVIDMNLSPDWVAVLAGYGRPSLHWSAVGDPRATDRQIMDWALAHGHVVFTHDLDFGTMLALTHAAGPSVLQIRRQNILPDATAAFVASILDKHEADLAAGALIVVDEARSRIRLLPL